MNGINLRKILISMENPGKITQKLLNTHYNVLFSFFFSSIVKRSIIRRRKKSILSDIENKRGKIAVMKNGDDDASYTSVCNKE